MNPLPFLVFILCLGYLNCFESWVDADPEISDLCEEQEKVEDKDIKDMDDMSVKCYYHCIYEKQGVIVNGDYHGNFTGCEGVTDSNKCELARKVVACSMPKTIFT